MDLRIVLRSSESRKTIFYNFLADGSFCDLHICLNVILVCFFQTNSVISSCFNAHCFVKSPMLIHVSLLPRSEHASAERWKGDFSGPKLNCWFVVIFERPAHTSINMFFLIWPSKLGIEAEQIVQRCEWVVVSNFHPSDDPDGCIFLGFNLSTTCDVVTETTKWTINSGMTSIVGFFPPVTPGV